MLIAPMLSLDNNKKKNWAILPLLGVLNFIGLAWLPVGAKEPNVRFPELEEEFMSHPLTYKGPIRVRMGVECIKAADAVIENASALTCPLLVFHSRQDTMCEPAGSDKLCSAAGSKDVTFSHDFDDMWHALLIEPGSERVMATMTSWLKTHSPKPRFPNRLAWPRSQAS